MATAYTVEDLDLQDDNQVILKPLPIARLRKFMKAWESFIADDFKSEEEAQDRLLGLALICLGPQGAPYAYDKTTDEDGEEVGYAKAYEVFDLPTIYRVIKVCSGIDLDAAPKALTETQTETGETGTTT